MRTSNQGIYDIADHEGVVPYPYLDAVSVWTSGVGHTATAGPPDPRKLPRGVAIPMSEVFSIFRRDLRKFEARVNATVKVPLAQHEFDALVSFDFNTGGIHKAALTRHLNNGDRKAAAKAFLNWQKPRSILKRRRKEQALFRDGIYSSKGHVAVYTANAAGKVDLKSVKLVNVAAAMTPKPRPKPEPVPTPEPEYSLALVGDVQQRLIGHGYIGVGAVDGLVGDRTRSSIRDFRAANGLPAGDHIDDALVAALKRPDAVRPVIAPERSGKTLDDLAAEGSEIAKASKKGKKGAVATFFAAIGTMVMSALDRAGDLVHLGPVFEQVRPYFETYGVWLFGTALLGLAGFIYWQSRKSGNARVADHRSGNTSLVGLKTDN